MASYSPSSAKTADSPYIILEITDREGETAFRVPVAVLNLTAGIVTLEAVFPQAAVGWDTISGRRCNLRLRFKGGEEPIDISGKLVWTRLAGENGRQLTLGLELTRPTLTARKVLGDLIPHSSKDIKGLWERWDQTYPEAGSSQSQRIYLLGMILLIGGVALQLGGKSLQLCGWILWFFGSLAVAGKSLWTIWQKKASR